MAAHVCDNCGSVVSSDDQFCPNCGAWIDPTTPDDGAGDDDYESFDLGDDGPPPDVPSPPVRLPQQEVQCPSCGSSNPFTNRHCEECGARLSQGALPVAPRPAVQTTAGVRAAMAISALLLGVVIVALLFNILGGDEDGGTVTQETTTTTTSIPPPTPDVIPILDATCSVDGLANFGCANLVDGTTEREYQINWETLEEGDEVTIELKFAEPMVLTSFRWENLPADSDRFFQNYRARDIIVSDGSVQGLGIRLENQGGEQTVPYASLRTLELTITVTSAYEPEPRDNNMFSELAIAEIRVVGYPASQVTTTTAVTTTTGG
ncbi:MAG TPA: zinc ribbon domain-containing protein [Acidimicrobiia bacterium]